MAKSMVFSVLMITVTAATLVCCATSTIEQDEKECADQLQNLAACVPFVSGSAKKPTPECCADAEKVRSSKPKCLCVLIIESTDPSLALPMNTTLALQMPAACNSDAKVSDCPSILKLAPDSPNAKIFGDASGDSSKAAAITPSPSSSTPAAGSSDAGSSDSKAAPTSNGGRILESGVMGVAVGIFGLMVAMY